MQNSMSVCIAPYGFSRAQRNVGLLEPITCIITQKINSDET